MSDDAITLLQNWYATKCDGKWEHEYGFDISNVDNPGWHIEVDEAADPYFSSIQPSSYKNPDDVHDWLAVYRKDDKIVIVCGPRNLAQAVNMLLGEPGASLS